MRSNVSKSDYQKKQSLYHSMSTPDNAVYHRLTLSHSSRDLPSSPDYLELLKKFAWHGAVRDRLYMAAENLYHSRLLLELAARMGRDECCRTCLGLCKLFVRRSGRNLDDVCICFGKLFLVLK